MEHPLTEQHTTPHAPSEPAAAADERAVPDVRTATDARAALDDRYGRTPARRRRGRLIGIVMAAAIVVVFAAWAIWAGPGQTDRGLDTDDVGYQVQSAHSTVVHTQVSVDPGNTVRCAVQVLDKSYGIVGWKVITLPSSTDRTRTVTTQVNTTTRGVTGLIHSCWIP